MTQNNRIFHKLGIALIILSFLVWLIPFIVPFTPISIKVKAIVITGSLIIAEILFWIGALFVGKEVAAKFKSYLNPNNWRKKHEKQEQDN